MKGKQDVWVLAVRLSAARLSLSKRYGQPSAFNHRVGTAHRCQHHLSLAFSMQRYTGSINPTLVWRSTELWTS
jgi:hypothetical protein